MLETAENVNDPATSKKFIFSSPEGRTFCENILAKRLPYAPHDFQLEGICKLLDGVDVLAVVATGMGKTALLFMFMMVAQEIAQRPSICPSKVVPKNPAMVVVCPTNALEEEMCAQFVKLGLDAVAVNSDTAKAAHKNGENIWMKVRKEAAITVLNVEQLVSEGFRAALADEDFGNRTIGLGIDEVHLMDSWGVTFKQIYRQIIHIRELFKRRPTLVALTATLRKGPHTLRVCDHLGLRAGAFHLIRLSNARYDMQLLFRPLKSSLSGDNFPELDWVLSNNRTTLIFARTIAIGFNIAQYLWYKVPDEKSRPRHIRMYNSLNWPSYNEETRRLMHHSGKDTQIVIATATLSVGIDIPGIQDVLIVGTPDMLEDLVQEFGRGGRGKDDCGTRGILYYSKSNLKNANEVVARAAVAHSSGKDIEAPSNSSNLGTHDTHMSLSMAQVLCGTSCIVDEVDLTCKSGPKPPLAVPCKKRSTILMCEGSRAILAPSSVS